MSKQEWIGVDLDGTLASYDKWRGVNHIGEPVPAMVERVKAWLAEGKRVKIFTARVCPQKNTSPVEIIVPIEQWCMKHLGCILPIVYAKDFNMLELWDDRAQQVLQNEGITVTEKTGEFLTAILDRLWAASEGHRETREEIVKIRDEFFS